MDVTLSGTATDQVIAALNGINLTLTELLHVAAISVIVFGGAWLMWHVYQYAKASRLL